MVVVVGGDGGDDDHDNVREMNTTTYRLKLRAEMKRSLGKRGKLFGYTNFELNTFRGRVSNRKGHDTTQLIGDTSTKIQHTRSRKHVLKSFRGYEFCLDINVMLRLGIVKIFQQNTFRKVTRLVGERMKGETYISTTTRR